MAARHVFEEALLALAVLSSCVAAVTSSQVSITTPSPIPYISTQVVTTSSGSFTELSIVAPSLTQLEFLESTFTRINDIGPSSLTTQVEYIDDISTVLLFYSGTAKTGFEDIQASFTEIDKIEPSRTIVEDIEASTTAVYSDIITLIHPSATVYTDLNNSTAYDLDNEDLWTYCWYPISSNYCLLPRVLFYFTLVFAILGFHHQWLVAGALSAGLIYSGVAAVHACLLVWRGPGDGELDQFALLAILSTSCVLIVPLLNWSKTLRHLGVEHSDKSSSTRTIIVYWAFLVAVGFLCLFVSYYDDHVPLQALNRSGFDAISCAPQGPLNFSAGQDPKWSVFIPDSEFIDQNNCVDPCARSYYPGAIFREAGDLQILTMAQINRYWGGTLIKAKEARKQDFYYTYQNWGIPVLAYVLLQGIWAACFGRRNPLQARDKVYLILRRFSTSQKPDGFRKGTMKWYAIITYAWAVFIAILCPPLLILNVIANELLVNDFPESETQVHVDAWGPWAAVVLVVIAALIGRFHNSMVNNLIRICNQAFYRVRQIAHKPPRRQRGMKKVDLEDGETFKPKSDRNTLAQNDRTDFEAPNPKILRSIAGQIFTAIGHPVDRLIERIKTNLQTGKAAWDNLKRFKNDPDGTAVNTDRHGCEKHSGHDGNRLLPIGGRIPPESPMHTRERLDVSLLPGASIIMGIGQRRGILSPDNSQESAGTPDLTETTPMNHHMQTAELDEKAIRRKPYNRLPSTQALRPEYTVIRPDIPPESHSLLNETEHEPEHSHPSSAQAMRGSFATKQQSYLTLDTAQTLVSTAVHRSPTVSSLSNSSMWESDPDSEPVPTLNHPPASASAEDRNPSSPPAATSPPTTFSPQSPNSSKLRESLSKPLPEPPRTPVSALAPPSPQFVLIPSPESTFGAHFRVSMPPSAVDAPPEREERD